LAVRPRDHVIGCRASRDDCDGDDVRRLMITDHVTCYSDSSLQQMPR